MMLKWIAVVLLALVSIQAPEFVLDLVTASRTDDVAYSAVPEGERADVFPPLVYVPHGARPPAPPFEVLSFGLDRNSYEFNESYDVQLRLRYTGTQSVLFPTSSEAHLFRRSSQTLRRVAVQLTLHNPAFFDRVQLIEKLYGDESVPGSLLTLVPNSTVVLYAKSRWTLPNRKANAQIQWPLTATVQLSLDVVGFGTTFDSLQADPAATIILTLPPED